MSNRHIPYVRVSTLEDMATAWQVDPRTLYRHLEDDLVPVDHVTDPGGMSRPRFNCEAVIRLVMEHNLVPLDRLLLP